MKKKTNNKILIAITTGSIVLSGCASKSLQVIDTNRDEVNIAKPKETKVSKWKSLTASKKKDCVNCYAIGIDEPIERIKDDGASSTIDSHEQITVPMDNTPVYEATVEENKNSYLDEVYAKDANIPVYEAILEKNKNLSLKDEVSVEDSNTPVYEATSEEDENPYLVDEVYAKNSNTPVYEATSEEDENSYLIDEVSIKDNNAPLYKKESEEDQNSYLVDESYSEDNHRSKTVYSKVDKDSIKEENEKVSYKNSIQVGAFRKYAGAKVYARRYSLLTSRYNVDIKENVEDNEPLYRVQIEGFSNENEARNFIERYGLAGAFLVRR